MSWNNDSYLIGEKIKVENEKDFGIVSRIDFERGLIYVVFRRGREEAYPYPESINQKILTPQVQPK